MIVKEETINEISVIRATCHTPLYILINKQKHSAGDSKTPRQSIPSNQRGRPRKNEKVNPCSDKYFDTDDKKIGDNPPRPLDNYDEALGEFKSQKLIFDSKLFAIQMDVSQNPLFHKLSDQLRQGRHTQTKEDIKN